MNKEKFDRTAFKRQTLEEASNNLEFWKKQSFSKRLEVANYLNSVAYNFHIDNPPKMDKSFFKIRKRK